MLPPEIIYEVFGFVKDMRETDASQFYQPYYDMFS